MNYKPIIFVFYFVFPVFLISCGTSTGSRYSDARTTTEIKSVPKSKVKTDETKYPENFDMSRYHSKIDVKDTAQKIDDKNLNVWYNYHEGPDTGAVEREIVKTAPGYRVQVLSTDNLDDANKMRSEIYFKTSQKAVYVVFDPPFYKVEVGDFTNLNDAKSLSFKFKQMGYTDSRVVNETINIFQ